MTIEVPYQAISPMEPKAVVILGIAVAMMVESSAARKMLKIRPMVIKSNLVPRGYCGAGAAFSSSSVGAASLKPSGWIVASSTE